MLDRADVLTMAEGDPSYEELADQEFQVSHQVSVCGGDKKKLGDKKLVVMVADKVLRKSVEYEAI